MDYCGISIKDSDRFDACLKGPGILPEGGDLEIITKGNATKGGRSVAMVTFTVQLPDGSMARAQAVTTVRLLLGALRVIEAQHGNEG